MLTPPGLVCPQDPATLSPLLLRAALAPAETVAEVGIIHRTHQVQRLCCKRDGPCDPTLPAQVGRIGELEAARQAEDAAAAAAHARSARAAADLERVPRPSNGPAAYPLQMACCHPLQMAACPLQMGLLPTPSKWACCSAASIVPAASPAARRLGGGGGGGGGGRINSWHTRACQVRRMLAGEPADTPRAPAAPVFMSGLCAAEVRHRSAYCHPLPGRGHNRSRSNRSMPLSHPVS